MSEENKIKAHQARKPTTDKAFAALMKGLCAYRDESHPDRPWDAARELAGTLWYALSVCGYYEGSCNGDQRSETSLKLRAMIDGAKQLKEEIEAELATKAEEPQAEGLDWFKSVIAEYYDDKDKIAWMVEHGLITEQGDKYALTAKGRTAFTGVMSADEAVALINERAGR